jgi:hypothetical protein
VKVLRLVKTEKSLSVNNGGGTYPNILSPIFNELCKSLIHVPMPLENTKNIGSFDI